MTNAEVYNFEIGDVHQTKLYGSAGPPFEYHLDTIVNKVVDVNSITYTIHRKTILNGPPPYPTISSSVETLVISNLTSSPSHFNYGSCIAPIDSSFIGNCGEGVDFRQSDLDSTCFEPPFWFSTLHEGLGGPYYDVYDFSNMVDYQYELIYSNSSQWGECGNYQDFFVGIEELTETNVHLIRIVDLLGLETEDLPNTLLIYVYSDGTTEKVVRIE
jgi:hypothetical protein